VSSGATIVVIGVGVSIEVAVEASVGGDTVTVGRCTAVAAGVIGPGDVHTARAARSPPRSNNNAKTPPMTGSHGTDAVRVSRRGADRRTEGRRGGMGRVVLGGADRVGILEPLMVIESP